MNFLAPLMLAGAGAVAIPVALHFFYKARYRPHPWAAMRFLRQAIEQTSRRLRFQEYVLLALRCLVILLLALAIARPTTSAVSAGRGESVDAVLVFDTSYSMGAADGEATRLDRAKAAALTVIDNLPPNSTAQVFAGSDRATHLGPVSPSNLDMARQVVENVELSSVAGEALPGLTEAFAALDRVNGTSKEVYLFTDLQKSGWDQQAAAIRAKAEEIRQRATLVVVRCGNPERPVDNVAVTDVSHPGGIPHTGARLPVTVLLKNTGRAPLKNLTVTLEVDGRRQETESATVADLPAGQTFPVNLLTAKLDEPGARLLTARVTSDQLPGDNERNVLVPVRDRVRVLVVDGAPDFLDPKRSAAHYVRNALVPVSGDRLADYFVNVTVVPAEEAEPGLLGANDICVLCNVPATAAARPGVPALSAAFVTRLGKFVRDGGGLVAGAGENVTAAEYNAVLGSGGAGLLPFDLTEPKAASPEDPFKPAPDATAAPSFLARFRDDPFRTVTADVDVLKVMGMRDEDRTGGRVLMRLTNRDPWIAARVVDRGEVVFAGTPFDETWSNWPAKAGSFVSFVQLTLSHLTGRASADGNRVAGQPLVWHPDDAPKPFELIRLSDRKRTPLGVAQGGDGGQKLTVTASDVTTAGVYQMALVDENPPTGPRFAVAPDLRESENLDALSDGEAAELLGFRPVLLLAGADGDSGLATERSRREWTVWVLLALFVVAVGEAGWAWLCGKAW